MDWTDGNADYVGHFRVGRLTAQTFSESTQSFIDNLTPIILAMLPSEKSPDVELVILDLLDVVSPFLLSDRT